MEWTGPNKKKLRKALIKIYNTPKKLAKFISDEFDLNLNVISSESNLDDRAYDLIEEGCADGDWIHRLYETLCEINPDHPAIDALQHELQGDPLIGTSSKLIEDDWKPLFANLHIHDFAYVQIAFFRAFKTVYGYSFREIRPDHPPLNEPVQIKKLLEDYDKPELVVWFIELVIVELQRSSDGEVQNLTALVEWRDHIAKQHSISLDTLETTPESPPKVGYLLVSARASGRSSQGLEDVLLYPELHLIGQANPIELGIGVTKCRLNEIGQDLSKFIHKAEDRLREYRQGNEVIEVILELFLPWQYLEEKITEWEVQDRHGESAPLQYRSFVVRSLDRVLGKDSDPTLMPQLLSKWDLLETCVEKGSPCEQFYVKQGCPKPGELKALLKKKAGLKLIGELPDDYEDRRGIFYNIIDSAIPIALWTNNKDCSPEAISVELDKLFQDSCLTNFASVAECLMISRAESRSETINKLKMLVDCPDRWPVSIPRAAKDSEYEDRLAPPL